jgi:hypothetical protein
MQNLTHVCMISWTVFTILHFLRNFKRGLVRYKKMEMLVRDKFANLLGPFVNYKEYVLLI